MTWLEGTVVVVAPILFASDASRSGEIARSFAAIMYHDAFDFQAGIVISPFICRYTCWHLRCGQKRNLCGGKILREILSNPFGSKFEETTLVGT
jgi:hypothetical protein